MPLRLPLALLVLLAVAACQSESGYAEVDAAAPMAEAYDREERTEASAASVIQPASQVDAPVPAERQLIRTAALRIRAHDHAQAVARARALAEVSGGVVGDESSQRYADRVETTLTIRVPSPRFDTLLVALSAIDGEVESRSVSVDDVTRQVADVEARLAARRAAETQFLAVLDRAGSIEDVLAVQVQLQRVREEIESAEAQLRAMRDQVALSTIAVTLFEASAAGITAGPSFVSRIGRAVGSGWDGLLELLLALITVWPLVLGVGALVWLAVRRRRRRMSVAG